MIKPQSISSHETSEEGRPAAIKNSNSQYLFLLAFPLHSPRFHHLFCYFFTIFFHTLTFLRTQSHQPRGQLSSCTMGFALSAPCGDDVPLAASPGNMFDRFLCCDGRERPGTLLWLPWNWGTFGFPEKNGILLYSEQHSRKAFNNLGYPPHLGFQ